VNDLESDRDTELDGVCENFLFLWKRGSGSPVEKMLELHSFLFVSLATDIYIR